MPPKQRQRGLEIFGGTADAAYAKLARDLHHQGRDLRQDVHVEVTVEVSGTHGIKNLDNLSSKFGANAWTNTASGTTLQSTTDLSPAVWSTNLPAPVVINGQNTVTNPISGTQQFYQLSRLQ